MNSKSPSVLKNISKYLIEGFRRRNTILLYKLMISFYCNFVVNCLCTCQNEYAYIILLFMYIGAATPQSCKLLIGERFKKPKPQIKYLSVYLSF